MEAPQLEPKHMTPKRSNPSRGLTAPTPESTKSIGRSTRGLDRPSPEGVTPKRTGSGDKDNPGIVSNIADRDPTPVRSGGSTGMNTPRPEGV